MTELVWARAFQGIGVGAMMSMPRATVGDIFSPKERAKWMGVMMAVFGLSSIIGPALGASCESRLARFVFPCHWLAPCFAWIHVGLLQICLEFAE
ncbi:MAG TPA: MFS transporter [Bacillales bacterium]|nr:MFS transporter [Bacillales bacterium]